MRNTFFRDFVAVPGMAQMYRELGEAAFHYVSGSPYQLYRPLAEFLFGEAAGFPQGTFHLLIGDSGEKDPEVYSEIKTKFPKQIEEIRIRDLNISRLRGMTILP